MRDSVKKQGGEIQNKTATHREKNVVPEVPVKAANVGQEGTGKQGICPGARKGTQTLS